MDITRQTIEHLCHLARLDDNMAQDDTLIRELEKILSYMQTLHQLDTSQMEPLSHVLAVENVFFEDGEYPSMPRAQLLRSAPQTKDGYYVVPRAVE